MKFFRHSLVLSVFRRAKARRSPAIQLRNRWRALLGLGVFQLVIALSPQAVKPSQSAEKITFSLGATIERSISLDSLERYVEDGEVTEELAPYLAYIDRLDPNAKAQVRSLLTQRADLDVVTVSQFAYTPQGDYLLTQAGEVFRTGARLSGRKGLRGAAIVSAADTKEGLTILNVVRNFPTPVLRVDIRRGLSIANQVSDAFSQSDAALELIQQVALQSATAPFPNGQSSGDVFQLANQAGPYLVRRLSVRVKASPKPVDVYLPQSPGSTFFAQAADATWPTVVISHGLGNDRESYSYLAQHLAAHGFAVINVEHRGSSGEQLDALVSGQTDEVVPNAEFISRPLLISQVLDDLSQIPDFKDKKLGVVDFNNVAIIGQSFGGYTALAVAGAPVNLAGLRQSCPPAFSVNISLLLQCQAAELNLGDQSLEFKDPRVKAVVAINPITSEIFGPKSVSQVDVPVLLMAGSRDTVAPALPEQIIPFTWLTMSDRYLVVMEGGTHFSTIGVTGAETFQLPASILGPVPDVAQRYTEVMSLAFLKVYLNSDRRYESILTSAFTNRFSQPELPLTIVPELDAEQLGLQLRLADLEGDITTPPEPDALMAEPVTPDQLETALKQVVEQLSKQKTDRQTTPTTD